MNIDRFENIVRNYVPCVGGVENALSDFSKCNGTIIQLSKNGIMAYTDEEDHYFVWFVFNDALSSNTRKIYKKAKELSLIKPVRYTGLKDFYSNNSITINDGIYEMKFNKET